MPYYVYAVQPFAQLEPRGEYATFPQASAQAKALRAQLQASASASIRVMFADTALQAEDLLLQVRQPRPTGEE